MKLRYAQGEIGPGEIQAALLLTEQGLPLLRRVVAEREAAKYAAAHGVTASDAELQEFANAFRRSRGLDTVAGTRAFLRDAGITQAGFEKFCEGQVLMAKVKQALAGERAVREYFFNNRGRFERATVSTITVRSLNLAKEIALQVEEGEEEFRTLAEKHSLEKRCAEASGYRGEFSRSELPRELAARIFGAAPGELLGPLPHGEFFRLVLVEERVQQQLDERLSAEIREVLFEQWIAGLIGEGFTAC